MYIVVLSHLFPLHLCSRRLELLQLLIWLGATTCDPLLRKYHRHRFVALLDCYPIQFGTIVIDTRVGIWLRQITALIPTVELDLHSGSVEPVLITRFAERILALSPTAVQADVPWRHIFGNCIIVVYTILQFHHEGLWRHPAVGRRPA